MVTIVELDDNVEEAGEEIVVQGSEEEALAVELGFTFVPPPPLPEECEQDWVYLVVDSLEGKGLVMDVLKKLRSGGRTGSWLSRGAAKLGEAAGERLGSASQLVSACGVFLGAPTYLAVIGELLKKLIEYTTAGETIANAGAVGLDQIVNAINSYLAGTELEMVVASAAELDIEVTGFHGPVSLDTFIGKLLAVRSEDENLLLYRYIQEEYGFSHYLSCAAVYLLKKYPTATRVCDIAELQFPALYDILWSPNPVAI